MFPSGKELTDSFVNGKAKLERQLDEPFFHHVQAHWTELLLVVSM